MGNYQCNDVQSVMKIREFFKHVRKDIQARFHNPEIPCTVLR
jgi:hypothetical protein